MLETLVALLLENTGFSPVYESIRELPLSVQVGSYGLAKPLILWVNDGLMAIFFLLVGLELKREVLDGQLSSADQIILPLAAAIGGMTLPALIFLLVSAPFPELTAGWAIPAATDIAFVLGVLSLFGSRIPLSIKIFLTALAIFDDIGAICIIALFYTADLSLIALVIASACSLLLLLINRMGVLSLSPYIVIGIVLWVAVLKSGVHATLAGVVVAMAIPFHNQHSNRYPLKELEHTLHSWVAYGVLPLFAFFNAGVDLGALPSGSLTHPLTLAIMLAIFLGKQVGVMFCSWLVISFGWASLPRESSWLGLYAASLLSGIGFTMSLFIGTLAYSDLEFLALVRLGVILGSLLSGLAGTLVLYYSFAPKSPRLTKSRSAIE